MSDIGKIIEKKYENEKELLENIRTFANNWYNDITGPLSGLLIEWLDEGDKINAEKYAEIADELFMRKIAVNDGTYLYDILNEMGNKGIPFLTPRNELRGLIGAYLSSGEFVKNLGTPLRGWNKLNDEDKESTRQQIVTAWKTFRDCRDDLVQLVNNQLRKLGANL